jgi:nucleoside-diphosphate-sugar epimerase|tara:strand:- start:8365 stop:9156 length:792 start_codon:yes stop_codon:yes gene_type:complete
LNTISILGSGWLGLPLAQDFIKAGYEVKASTTSENRIADLTSIGAKPFIVNIDTLTDSVKDFLQSDILIVNITSKNIEGFSDLVTRIEASDIQKIIFVSSTSVYENSKRIMTESDTEYYKESPLLAIESLFQHCRGTETTIVRFGGLIGYRRHPGNFFKSKRVVQNPDAPVNLIHRDDCVGILREIVEQQIWDEIFNCCADTHPGKREFYTRAANLIDNTPPEFGESNASVGKIISNHKVKQLLNYEFKHPDLMKLAFNGSTV